MLQVHVHNIHIYIIKNILKSSTLFAFKHVRSHKSFQHLLVLSSVVIILVDTFSVASYTGSVNNLTCLYSIVFKSQQSAVVSYKFSIGIFLFLCFFSAKSFNRFFISLFIKNVYNCQIL